MNKAIIINILNQSTFQINLSIIPRVGETLKIEGFDDNILLIHGICYDLREGLVCLLFVEPINEIYWRNDI
ncbi:hypothetical protein [Enterococcus sp. 5B3_DIV0040]|uniref:hypothetical protein n=1 Tax=Enterococcus sp. 5B3_DIV0040 TaxID=1834182 RepID=UPI00113294AF|nr:hypothetical protein [Enterococcus sp. 5B3_DIV0040]